MSGYICHNLFRKFQNKNARRCSGGVVVCYKDHLKSGIRIVKNVHDTIIWVKVDKNFFDLEKDVYICGSYICGDESPAYNIVDVDLFSLLEGDISFYREKGDVFITRDFNARVGNKFDFKVHDDYNVFCDEDYYLIEHPQVRTSVDSIHNSHELKLLDLCKSTLIRIVNSRIGDSNHHTFYSHNGCSVIDYLLAQEENFSLLKQFGVGTFNEWSDHALLHFSLYCNNTARDKYSYTETKYKWKSNLTAQFRSIVIANLPNFNSILNSISTNAPETVNNAVDQFSWTLHSISHSLFSKRVTTSHSPYFVNDTCQKNAEWFDAECLSARQSYLYALCSFNLLKNEENRSVLCSHRKLYKDLVKYKKKSAL